MDLNELFWNSTTEDIKNGYFYNKATDEYICLICGEKFENGTIYNINGSFSDAKKSVSKHIGLKHGSMFDYLLNFNKNYTKLTDNQKEILKLYYDGLSDKEIVEKTSANATSTIRNSRFAMKEKYKQAKITVAITELLEEHRKTLNLNKTEMKNKANDELIDIHRYATALDERFAITQSERDEILIKYFDSNKKLIKKEFPKKEKRRIVIFQVIMENFALNKNYTEKEVNKIISEYYADIETVRRYLINYGFMDRTKDGSKYWVKI